MSVSRGGRKTFDVRDLQQALGQAYLPNWFQNVVALLFYGALLAKYDLTARVLNIPAAEFGPVAWRVGLLFAFMAVGILLSTYVGNYLFRVQLGISYTQDRMAYARAGAYDVQRFLPMLAQAVLFGVFWWTREMEPDPIGAVRGFWYFNLFAGLAALALSVPIYYVLFLAYAARNR